jgi:hypothetical protein
MKILTVKCRAVAPSDIVWMGAKHNCFSHQNCEKHLCFAPIQNNQLKIDLNMEPRGNPYYLFILFYPTYVRIGMKSSRGVDNFNLLIFVYIK